MDLLPKTREEFAQADYWNTFFKKRGEKTFEWYGEYLELCDQIHKYVKPPDRLLMLGCGNSKLSMDMYDSGFRNIINIDISAVAIKKMIEINKLSRPDMKFIQMDATAMTFEDNNFSVALDKGTLDAIFIDNSSKTKATVEQYFKEILRVLRNGGRYLCVSLLQEHILQFLLEFFPKQSCMIRIVYLMDVERVNKEKNADIQDGLTIPTFFIIVTKFKNLDTPILEFSLGNKKLHRAKNIQEIISAIFSIQKAALVCSGLARTSIAGHNKVTLDLYKPDNDTPRFTVHILDHPPTRDWGKYAVFIVPQGREIEWLFATDVGRTKLQASAKYQRLAIVTMHRDQEYTSLDDVKAELAYSVKSLSPFGLTEAIPYLSLGCDVGKRETLLCGFSKISGDFRIEDVEGSKGKLFRRLIFLSNQFVVQSEALVKIIKPKGKKERKKIDIGNLACQHHLYMSVGVQLATTLQNPNNDQKHVLVVGLGGGGLCSFIQAAMMNTRLTAVEIDPIMLEVAEQFFELKQDKRFHVVIDDGLAFLERCRSEEIKFDAVLFDVDSKDMSLGMSCPPKNFLEPAVLSHLSAIIGSKGFFILNLVCRDDSLRVNAIRNLQKVFSAVCCYKLDEDINEVVYCTNDSKYKTINHWRKKLETAGCSLNSAVRDHKLITENMIEISEFLQGLSI